jgi:hypothetical protein
LKYNRLLSLYQVAIEYVETEKISCLGNKLMYEIQGKKVIFFTLIFCTNFLRICEAKIAIYFLVYIMVNCFKYPSSLKTSFPYQAQRTLTLIFNLLLGQLHEETVNNFGY